MSSVAEGLNAEQARAVEHEGGPLVVFAGAGSGKTRVITHRVAHLIRVQGVAPWRVLAVTFTNKAAGEMRERLAEQLGPSEPLPWVGTFHATCAALLRRHAEDIGIKRDFTIYDDADQQAMVKRVLRDLELDERRFPPKRVAGRINRAKQDVLGPEDMPADDYWTEQVVRIYRTYQEQMERAGALDFGDLIYRMVVALETDDSLRRALASRFEHVLVDEFQDTNHAQYRLLRCLCADHHNLCVVGDDDQSIYRWRGADPRNILGFEQDFPGARVVKLEQNYRSTQRILEVANAVIERNREREPKRLWSDNEQGPKVRAVRCSDERDEAAMVLHTVRDLQSEGYTLSDLVVFYRIHAQSRVFEETLRSANVAYQIVGGTRFYDRAEIKDLLAYLRVVQNPDDDVSLLRIINTPARGIGKTTIDRIMDAAARSGGGVWHAVRHAQDNAALGKGAKAKLSQFASLLQELQGMAKKGASLAELGHAVAERTGYLDALREQDTPEADARMQNVEELLGSMEEMEAQANEPPTLAGFLERVTLETSADELDTDDRLTLMTVHAAKGLEFPVVIATGLEERMFPFRGANPWDDPDELEEERRLAYVAFTRARKHLILSWAAQRRIFGSVQPGDPSRFLAEMPEEHVEWIGVPRPVGTPASRASDTSATPFDDGVTYVDYAEGSDLEPGFQRGMRVRHPRFGSGRVRDVADGLPPRVTVEFDEGDTRRIAANFLEPA